MIRLVGLSISGMPGLRLARPLPPPQIHGDEKRTGPALRSEIPENDDRLLALLDRAALDRTDKVILGVKGTCFTSETEALFSSDLRDGAPRRQVSFQDPAWRTPLSASRAGSKVRREHDTPDMACGLDRLIQRSDNVLAGREFSVLVCPAFQVFAQSLAGHGHVIAVDKVIFEQVSQNLCNQITRRVMCTARSIEGHLLGMPPIL